MLCTNCGSETPVVQGRCTICHAELAPKVSPKVAAGLLTPPLPATSQASDPDVTRLPFDPPPIPGDDATRLATGTDAPRTPPVANMAAGDTSPSGTSAHQHGLLAHGQAFGARYHIIRLLGAGGMGAVYQAWDQELEVAVALKIIRSESIADPNAALDMERRFKRELLLARQVTHRNVVRIHDLGEINGVKYITMPYIQGSDLASVLKREGKLTVPRALAIARQVASGLSAAHEAGVVHRDLKPANIMIDADDHALIMDFGIARSTSSSAGGTVAGAVVGTLEYMAPEQARGEVVDQRADVYAFGLILYDMLVGRRQSSRASSLVSELMERMKEPPPTARSIDPTIPEALDRIVTRCLQPDPAARFQTSAEVGAALDLLDAEGRLLRGTAATAIPLPAPIGPGGALPFWKRPLIWAIAACLALVLAGTLWFTRSTTVEDHSTTAGRSVVPPTSERKLMAVLPFRVAGDPAALGFVATGVTESLATRLFQLKDVSVASASAVESVAKDAPIAKVAQSLGVNMVVTGSVQGDSNRIRILVNLEDTVAGKRRWSQEFSGVVGDLLTLEDRISAELLTALNLEPSIEETARGASHPTENIEAYELYLKGRNSMRGQQDLRNVRAAIGSYEEALKKDPRFALAYAGLADAALQVYRETRESLWADKALFTAQQAQQLDDNLVEVHFALGSVYQARGRTAEAIVELRRGLELAPNSDEGHRRLGEAYLRNGQTNEALRAYQKAIDVNPYYWMNYNWLGAAYLQLGAYDKAVEANRKVLELEPDNVNGHNDMGVAYLQLGQYDQAATAFQNALKALPTPETFTNLGTAYYYSGKFKEAVPMYAKAVELSPNSELFIGNLGDGYRWAGERDKAIAAYDKAIALAYKELLVNPRSATTKSNLAIYYAKKGDAEQSLKFIRDARAIDAADVNIMYNEVLVNALASRPSDALTALDNTLKAGYPTVIVASDPDLGGLRKDPRFAQLMARFKPHQPAQD